MDNPSAVRLPLGACKDAPEVNRAKVGFAKPHGAVNARAFVPPALVFGHIDKHRKRIFRAVLHHVGDVDLKRRVTTEIVLHQATVQRHGCVPRHALKQQGQTLALVPGGNVKTLDIPPVVVFAEAERRAAGGVVAVARKIIVRERDLFPVLGGVLLLLGRELRSVRDVVVGGRGSHLIALGFCALIGNHFVPRRRGTDVSAMEHPTVAEELFFSHKNSFGDSLFGCPLALCYAGMLSFRLSIVSEVSCAQRTTALFAVTLNALSKV